MGSNDAQWLFRQQDLILGPVPASKIVEKINSGELDGKSQVQEMGDGQFSPLATIEVFRVYLAKAEARSRVNAQAVAHEQNTRKKRNTGIVITVVTLGVVGIGVAIAGSYLAIHTPGRNAEDLAYGDFISMDAPTISAARKRTVDEDLVDYPGLGNTPKKPGQPIAARPNTPGKPKLNTPESDAEGLQMGEVDQDAINKVVAVHKKSLNGCLAKVYKPGVVQKIPIDFAIGNDGRVNKLWVDNPDYKSGELPDCLLKELQRWPFPNNLAGGASVKLSFSIGKAG